MQWGQPFTTSVISDIASNITKTPNDSIILAVAVKQVNKRIDDLIATIKTLQKTETAKSGFEIVPLAAEVPVVETT